MDRRHLECFVAIATSGRMAEAARQLHVSQPALSQTIKALEQELGIALFHRLPRGVALTSAGERLLVPARQMLRDFETLTAQVAAVRGMRTGHVDLMTLPGLIYDPLARWLGTYRRHWPGISVRIDLVETPHAVAEAVRTGAAELGLTIDVSAAEDLATTQVGHQELVAVFPAGMAGELSAADISLEELMELRLITGKRGTLIRDLAEDSARRRGVQWRPVIEIERRDAAVAFVSAGAGVAVLPQATGELQAKELVITRRLRPRIRRPVSLVHRRDALSPAAAALRDVARMHE
ncbi:LysR family transcriptional regulator [Calidifontibacter sp. DB0510]|uniref:LysR family transcriptional regulator n=1 Tax=Metallococcus carri TaxID=1656884 RepID=A0A967AZS1_9MICO|nr:LysR family transcriptional regulator [Metallococcus carri]NHN54763.1 LysR family transcriptional regulator [Metallococcus carri]NOP37108.1 LysR family transcriptional regulator [Calidifontibacter sp. DB2511S]